MSGDNPEKPLISIEHIGMSGKAKSTGGSVTATSGGADHLPAGTPVRLREVGMEGEAVATDTNVQASQNRDLFVGGQSVAGDQVDVGTAVKGNLNFGDGQTAVLCLAGAGTSSEVFKKDVDRMAELFRGNCGISEDTILRVKHRKKLKGQTKDEIDHCINMIQEHLKESDDGYFIFYYSGHFGQKGFKVDDKKNTDVDDKKNTDINYYTDKQMADELMKIPAKYMLFIMDMCRSGSAELGAKEEDGLNENGEAECNLWEYFTKLIETKGPEEGAGSLLKAEKVVQWASSGDELSFTHNPSQSSFFTNAIFEVITQPERAGRELRNELTPGQTHVTVLHVHNHVVQHIQTALQEYKKSQMPVIKPPHADEQYFKTFPHFAKLK